MTSRPSGRNDGSRAPDAPTDGNDPIDVDVVVIGAGFSGLYAIHKLRGLGFTVRGFEAGDGPGGTWYWNRYPGARVDIESMAYSYSFDSDLQQEWRWPEHFSPQPDLERYANHVADRFRIRDHIAFGTRIERMVYAETDAVWHVHTDRDDHVVCRFVVAATGSLDAAYTPDIAGLDSYAGETYHTARWPAEGVELAGRRVGVIGTGSTGIQLIPAIAGEVAALTVFQRTPNFSLPSRNRPMEPEYEARFKADYSHYRALMRRTESAAVLTGRRDVSIFDVGDEERSRALEEAWEARNGFKFMGTFNDIRTDMRANDIVAEFLRDKIRQIVHDPEIAEQLCPTGYPLGAKRLCLDTGYYETFNLDHVQLVDLQREQLVGFTPAGLRTSQADHPVDIVIFATGFDAMTGALTRIDVTGRGGASLSDHWADGPRTHLGFMSAGFPNMFMIHGPGSPSVLAQMIMGAEFQIDWLGDLLDHLRARGARSVEVGRDVEDDWSEQVAAAAAETIYPQADSWYLGANIPGKPRVFSVYVGGFERYCDACNQVAERDYDGFAFDR